MELKALKFQSYILILLVSLLSLSLTYIISSALYYAPINPDAGYLIPMTERIYDGLRLYKDIKPTHLTAVMYLLSPLHYLFDGQVPYPVFQIVQLLFLIGGAVFIFLIMRSLSRPVLISLYVPLIYIISSLLSEGTALVLEPYTSFFLLIGLYALINSSNSYLRVILSGIAFGIAFITKQYGVVGILGAVATLLLTRDGHSYKSTILRLTAIITGFIAVLLVYYCSISIAGDISLLDLLHDLRGGWYRWNVEGFLPFVSKFTRLAPHILLIPFLLISSKLRTRPITIAIIITGILSLLPGVIRQYYHYFILALPFSTLLIALIDLLVEKSSKITRSVWVFYLMILVFILSMRGYVSTNKIIEQNLRSSQYKLAAEINTALPINSEVLNLANPIWMYLCGLRSVNNLTVGYNFLEVLKKDILIDAINAAPNILVDWSDKPYFTDALNATQMTVEDFVLAIKSNRNPISLTGHPYVEIWRLKKQ